MSSKLLVALEHPPSGVLRFSVRSASLDRAALVRAMSVTVSEQEK